MPTTTKTVGSSVSPSRDYSTFTAWEAQLENATDYPSTGHDIVADVYDDSPFDEDVTIEHSNGRSHASLLVNPATSHGHDGTAGTGVRIVATVDRAFVTRSETTNSDQIDLIEMDLAGNDHGGANTAAFNNALGTGNGWTHTRCLIHDVSNNNRDARGYICDGQGSRGFSFCNNIIYDINVEQTDDEAYGIDITGADNTNSTISNNTVYAINSRSGTSAALSYGIDVVDDADLTLRNNLVIDCTNGTSYGDFRQSSFTNVTHSNNMSSDATSPDSSYRNVSTSTQFVSTTNGSEDLHLVSGSDAIDAGFDMGTTAAFAIDIDGRNRDTETDTWDIGADELVAAGGAFPYQSTLHRKTYRTMITR